LISTSEFLAAVNTSKICLAHAFEFSFLRETRLEPQAYGQSLARAFISAERQAFGEAGLL
jgi:hypothetical protein